MGLEIVPTLSGPSGDVLWPSMATRTEALPADIGLERWVRVRRRLNAPPDRTFRAWADPEELARWYPDRVEGGLAQGTRSILVWQDRRVWIDVVEVTASSVFVFRWPWLAGDRLVSTARIVVEPAGYGSQISVQDGPFQLADADGLEAWSQAIATWAEALAMLRGHIDFSVDLRERP